MPTRTPQDARLTAALLPLGCVGLVASGLGLLPAVPAWCWLVVLVLGWCLPLLARHAGARRFDAAERRRNEKARRNLRIARRQLARAERRLLRRMDAAEAVVKAGLQPDEAAVTRKTVLDFAADLQEMKTVLAKLLAERNNAKFGETFGEDSD